MVAAAATLALRHQHPLKWLFFPPTEKIFFPKHVNMRFFHQYSKMRRISRFFCLLLITVLIGYLVLTSPLLYIRQSTDILVSSLAVYFSRPCCEYPLKYSLQDDKNIYNIFSFFLNISSKEKNKGKYEMKNSI